jgi:hypothetical protein
VHAQYYILSLGTGWNHESLAENEREQVTRQTVGSCQKLWKQTESGKRIYASGVATIYFVLVFGKWFLIMHGYIRGRQQLVEHSKRLSWTNVEAGLITSLSHVGLSGIVCINVCAYVIYLAWLNLLHHIYTKDQKSIKCDWERHYFAVFGCTTGRVE